jgi:hypothetical protein
MKQPVFLLGCLLAALIRPGASGPCGKLLHAHEPIYKLDRSIVAQKEADGDQSAQVLKLMKKAYL